jgi:hypothetical protein
MPLIQSQNTQTISSTRAVNNNAARDIVPGRCLKDGFTQIRGGTGNEMSNLKTLSISC